jgi:FtsP/CotA-like multicopper oxidase with cupredoxin domain
MTAPTRRDLLTTGAVVGGAALLVTAGVSPLAGLAHAAPKAPSPAGPPRATPGAPPHAHPAPLPAPTPAPPPTPAEGPDAERGARRDPREVGGSTNRRGGGWLSTGTVETPNGSRMPWRVVDGVKVFHIIANTFTHEIAPGLEVECWGYNGSTPGPTIEVTEGDRCRFHVTNRLPEATTIHWHGVVVPNGMDGVAGATQRAIAPGETFTYEFTFRRAGTFMYHPHSDEMIQMALGMNGMIVVHPRRRPRGRVRDYALMLHEWRIPAGARRPDPLAMSDFNVLTINSRAYPGTAPLVAEVGDRVRIRLGNLSPMDHHPMHIHGPSFEVVETDGGPVPRGARWPEASILVPVGTVRVVELIASEPGDWPFHCHMTHHVMNQMGHALPPAIGADMRGSSPRLERAVPGYMAMGSTGMGEMSAMKMTVPKNSIPMKGGDGPFGIIDMGGMFTFLKVRDRLRGGGDPGWYQHPAGTVASLATAAALKRDGIELP